MEPVPISRRLKLNRKQHSAPIDLIQPPSILQMHISLAKSPKGDTSYSPFLNPNDPILSTINKTDQDEYSGMSIFNAEKYFNGLHDHNSNASITPKQSDLSPVPKLSHVSSINDCYNGWNYRTRWIKATPRAVSQASWNSQTGLLSNPLGSAAVSNKNLSDHKDMNTRTPRWFRLRKCPCSGKKSVQVEEANSEYNVRHKVQLKSTNRASSSFHPNVYNRPSSLMPCASYAATAKPTLSPLNHNHRNWNYKLRPQLDHQIKLINKIQSSKFNTLPSSISLHAGHTQVVRSFADSNGNTTTTTAGNSFTFPIPTRTSHPAKPMFNVISPGLNPDANAGTDNPSRNSLEVFQPREPRHSISRERSCPFTYPMSPKSRRMSYEEDLSSDASSDLFEIESFSTPTTSYRRGHSIDEIIGYSARRVTIATEDGGVEPRRSIDEPMTPSVAAIQCYAPTEVSVVWSVSTAEGFDHASHTNFSVTAVSEVEHGGGRCRRAEEIGDGGRGRRPGNGGLLRCQCEKAVSVGPAPIKCSVSTVTFEPGRPSQNTRQVNVEAQYSLTGPPVRSADRLC